MSAQATELGELVKDTLRECPSLPSQRIATIINEKHPEFDHERIRRIVRWYRGQNGKESRDTPSHEEFKYEPCELPPAWHYDSSPFIIPEKSALVLADVHFPVQDNQAIDTAITWALKHKENHPLEAIIINGDLVDQYQLSHFLKNPDRPGIAEEIDCVKDFLQVLQDAFGVKVYYKFSNHERRFENYIFTHAEKIANIKGIALEYLFQLEKYKCVPIKDKRIIKFGKLNIIHGDEIQGGSSSPVNPARSLYLKCKVHTLGSHSHVTSEHTEKNANRELITCWSTGCLCDLYPEWNPINKWNHGFAYIHRDDEVFRVVNLRIENGIVY